MWSGTLATVCFEAMWQQGLMPGVITYNVMTSAAQKGQQPECAWEVFDAMQRQEHVAHMITHSALISTCEKGQWSECVWEVFEARLVRIRADVAAEAEFLWYSLRCCGRCFSSQSGRL